MKFESHNVTFLSRLALSQMGVTQGNVLGNDCWGWTDSATGREFAIFGLTNGTAFVEITNPTQPIYLGTLPTAHGNAAWRDIKVYNSRAYIVADGSANSNHGVQVFNLKQLLTVRNPPATLTATARFTGIGRAHNIAINEKTGYAYVIGSPSLASAGGLIMLDLKKGAMPELAGVFSEDGYVHDTQVVTYSGPDTDYNGYFPGGTPSQFKGREIAFCCNEDTLTIVDVTDKTNPVMISRTGYPQAAYTHQGWLSEDHLFFYVNDELDETSIPTTNTRTHIWLVRKLSSPLYLGFSEGTERTIDHNLYVKGKYIYQANYTSGLRILGQTNPIRQNLEEVGFFDTYPADNAVSFNGAWSVYPYFPSGNIIVSDRQNGLFVLRFDE
ncbi:MAG TPA: choice-of-anchor B family protein [Pirellulaceae bacterium]|nr:choice-of-anchor B family protein [Pirellulaceae bacterium]HMP70047.1 choice-of-anchor B family protein [Pirellulaceae bacterium]